MKKYDTTFWFVMVFTSLTGFFAFILISIIANFNPDWIMIGMFAIPYIVSMVYLTKSMKRK